MMLLDHSGEAIVGRQDNPSEKDSGGVGTNAESKRRKAS